MISGHALRKEQWIRLSAVILILFFSIFTILQVKNLLLSFVLAFVVNYPLNPFVNALERFGLSRIRAVSALFIILGTIFGLISFFLLPRISMQWIDLKNDLPQYIQGISVLAQQLEQNFSSVFGFLPPMNTRRITEEAMAAVSSRFVSNLPDLLSTVITVSALAPLFAFFMLVDGKAMIKKLLSIIPNPVFETSLHLLYQINLQVGGYIRARLLESMIVGGIVGIGLFLIDSQYGVFLGVFAGLANLVPYVGPIIGAVPGVMLSLIRDGSNAELWMVLSVYAIAQIIDNLVIIPLVVAKIVNLHAAIVLVVMLVGAQLGGILGMIISIPLASIIKLTAETVYRHLTAFRV